MPELTESNTYGYNAPGWYKDPQSKAELEVSQPAAADALVRLGWQPISVDKVASKEVRVAEEAPATYKVENIKGTKRYYRNGTEIPAKQYQDEVSKVI